jgi:uncharacterized protein (DUF2062 family)
MQQEHGRTQQSANEIGAPRPGHQCQWQQNYQSSNCEDPRSVYDVSTGGKKLSGPGKADKLRRQYSSQSAATCAYNLFHRHPCHAWTASRRRSLSKGNPASMPRRFFRKFAIKRQHIGESWLLSPFRSLMHEPRYWGIRRRTAVPAFATGLFIAWAPFPGHPLMATFAAIALRINIPVAVITTFISNPLTMYPMYYFAYRLGRALLGTPPTAFDFELSLAWVGEKFSTIWQPLTLGCVLLGATSALVGYVILDALWRSSLNDYKRRKRGARSESQSSDENEL